MACQSHTLECLDCGRIYEDEYNLACRHEKPLDYASFNKRWCNSLLRASYQDKKLVFEDEPGLFRYGRWLPVKQYYKTESGPVTYRSEGLARELGLKNLYIGFCGYWPERNARTLTCSFKEYEAFPTLQRVVETGGKSLILASAGNTGRAFAHASNLTGVPVTIVIPETARKRLWIPGEAGEKISLICIKGDYFDSIQLAGNISARQGMRKEGGARNVARRDGMGTVFLDGAAAMKRMPDRYFQAIGSGTGGIAAWEAALRLIGDGDYGKTLPKLELSQNLPFAPMHNAWKDGRREIIPEDMPDAKKSIEKMHTDILSNRSPPYSVRGGVYDALTDCGGRIWAVENREAVSAGRLFESSEEIDILPAAEVAVASLIKAVEEGAVDSDEYILLNVTGGGQERLMRERDTSVIKPSLTVNDIDAQLGDLL